NTAIGNLPITTKENYYFMGWYTSSTGGTRISANTIITDDVTYYAHWATEAVAEINGFNYSNLEDAITEVPTDNTETTIKLLMNTSASLVTIEENQNIVFDLQNIFFS
ncbi:MAG: InlB B-repeat-containing protein, partial [Elusimicrobia bacterium]|nr:InlB B-repeat-containing protein [Elusimicrobiota bacterium]